MPRDDTIKTGVTVLTADAPFTASVSVMGGAPGTRETDLLAPDRTVQQVDAIVLSGGSAFGLDAAQGVAEGLRAAGRGFPVHGMTVPIVPAAIILDLANGGAKDWATSPYPALGAHGARGRVGGFRPRLRGRGDGGDDRRSQGRAGLRLRHVERLHGRCPCGRQPGRAGHGGRWPAFPRRPAGTRR
jgi:hypothetical protein